MLFKAAVCLMAVVIMMFSTVSALAAADYYTTTTYNLTTGLATVKTTVTGATGEVAYLAYEGNNPEDDDAVFYIDQITATGVNDVFEYTVEAAKIDVSNTHSILVGTSSEGQLPTETEGVVKLGTDYELTVNFTGCKVVLTDNSVASATPNTVTLNKSGIVTVGNGNSLVWRVEDVDSAYDANTAKATLNGVSLDGNQVVVSGNATLEITMDAAKKDTTIVVESSDAEIDAASCVSKDNAENPNTGEAVVIQRLTRMGTIVLGDDDIEEYGIVITDASDNDTKRIIGGGNDLLKTHTNGKFAIIIEGVDGELDGTYYVQTFVKVKGVYQYGATYVYENGVARIENADQ